MNRRALLRVIRIVNDIRDFIEEQRDEAVKAAFRRNVIVIALIAAFAVLALLYGIGSGAI